MTSPRYSSGKTATSVNATVRRLRWPSPIFRICDGTNEIATAQSEIEYTGQPAGAEVRSFTFTKKTAPEPVRK